MITTPHSFLLTVHEPGSAVLEELTTGRRVRITELVAVGEQVARWVAEREDALADGAADRAGDPRPGS